MAKVLPPGVYLITDATSQKLAVTNPTSTGGNVTLANVRTDSSPTQQWLVLADGKILSMANNNFAGTSAIAAQSNISSVAATNAKDWAIVNVQTARGDASQFTGFIMATNNLKMFWSYPAQGSPVQLDEFANALQFNFSPIAFS